MEYPKALYLDGWSNLGSYKAARSEEGEAALRAEGYKTLPEFPHPDNAPPVAVGAPSPTIMAFADREPASIPVEGAMPPPAGAVSAPVAPPKNRGGRPKKIRD